jgi:DNA polymerase-1
MLDQFEEIVLVDFEFNNGDRNPRGEGNRPNIVCMVAHELRSGRRFRLWHDQLEAEPPYRTDARTLTIAFYASAELTCHLSKGWSLPINILDCSSNFVA